MPGFPGTNKVGGDHRSGSSKQMLCFVLLTLVIISCPTSCLLRLLVVSLYLILNSKHFVSVSNIFPREMIFLAEFSFDRCSSFKIFPALSSHQVTKCCKALTGFVDGESC